MMRKKTAVLISGQGSNLQALMRACVAPDFPAEIGLVIANKKEAVGLQIAQAAGIPTQVILHQDYPTRESFDAALHNALTAANIDLVCLAGFMRILTAELVEKWQGKMINIHPSLLPKYKGVDTHQRALDAGDKEAGCSVHFVTPELDAGKVILQAVVPILSDDTAEKLAARVLMEEHKIYPQALKLLAEGAVSLF